MDQSAITDLRRFGLNEGELPPELEESFQRHRKNLARLVLSLRSAGFDESRIEISVSAIVASYKEELTRCIKEMMK